MSKKAVKRILTKDMKEIVNQKLEDLGIFIQFNEENILEAKAMIVGPNDSLYAGGILFFKITFPHNYPFSPPDVVYISRNKIKSCLFNLFTTTYDEQMEQILFKSYNSTCF